MPTRSGRLICVGKDLDLLKTRCAVLAQSGYETRSANLSEAQALIRTEVFDLVIVSAWLSEWERKPILAAAAGTPVLVLTQATLAEDLLAQVAQSLQEIP
jgi:DNA-binding response OmpR family regulator